MANETRNMNRKVRISPMGVPGGVARMTWKIGKLELQNFILTKNSKLYESMHQRKFPLYGITQDMNIIITCYKTGQAWPDRRSGCYGPVLTCFQRDLSALASIRRSPW